MSQVALADAKTHLSDLVERARKGEPILITRRGKPVARLVGLAPAARPIDPALLHPVTGNTPEQPEPAGTALRRQRDDARY